MQKTVYQTPELRDANDNVVQEGAFGKNTALSNSTNDGWIDYVVNNLEALHDTIGDSAAHLDGNGHVVEPANLAIGDEDGNRLKTSYLKLTGGTVAGTLNVQQNLKFQDNQENVFGGVYIPSSSATEQYAQFYGGEGTGVAGAKLTLYPDGDGRFKLEARSTDGANTYTLVTDNNGNLKWRGYPLAWKKDYLPLAGGTMTGDLKTSYRFFGIRNEAAGQNGQIAIFGGGTNNNGAYLSLNGMNASYPGYFSITAHNGTNSNALQGRPDGTLTWGGKNIERIESSGTNYIRYVSGLQICWGAMNVPGAAVNDETITFPMPFKDGSSYNITAGRYWAYSKDENYHIKSQSGTGFTWSTIGTVSTNSHSYRYIATGWWK